jgi:diamine N-acetyltransferase
VKPGNGAPSSALRPPPSLSIRPAVTADYELICELAEFLDAPQREALPERFRKPEGPMRRRDLTEKLIADPETFLRIAELDGRAAGIINAGIEQMPDYPQKRPIRSVLIRGIVVRPALRHRGIATALMNAVTDWARQQRATEVQLNVYEFNRPAAAFFARLGYAQLSRRLVRSIPSPD